MACRCIPIRRKSESSVGLGAVLICVVTALAVLAEPLLVAAFTDGLGLSSCSADVRAMEPARRHAVPVSVLGWPVLPPLVSVCTCTIILLSLGPLVLRPVGCAV